MAILNNLIVNGNSRILNTLFCKNLTISGTTTFNTITVSSAATFNGSATFNSSVNVKGTSIEIFGSSTQQTPFIDFHHNNSSADYTSRIIESESGKLQIPKNFQVVGTMTTSSINNSGLIFSENINVANTLRATRFDLQTISSTGGSLYVSPTVKYPNSGTTLGVAKSGSTLTLTITDSSITSTTMAGVVWAANSKVKVSGEINGVPTGTMDGTVTSINTSSHVMVITASGENSGSVAAGTYSASQFANLSVMIYQRRDGSNDYRVGIWLNCYDIQNSSATIRIYAGNSVTPNVMLGNLTGAGLGTVNNLTPEGWGLFAQNAFLHGRIVSTSGLIGGWTLDSNSLHNGTWGTENGAMFCTGTTSAKSIGGSASISGWTITSGAKFGVTKAGVMYCSDAHVSGEITATSGKIGGWNVGSVNLTKDMTGYRAGIYAPANPTTGNVAFYIATLNGTAESSYPFYVNYGGELHASKAFITGSVTATSGKIGGWTIESNAIEKHTDLLRIRLQAMDSPTDGNYAIRVDTRTSTSADWANKIALGYGGYFYAGNATIVGTITANTGYIGGTSGWTIASQQLSSGTIGSDSSMFLGTKNLGSSTSIAGRAGSDWRFTVGSHFGVTNTGVLYCNSATLTGSITATSGYIGGTSGFYITTNKMYSNNHSAYNTAVAGVYIGTDYISLGSGGVTYFKNDGTGKIGKWIITTTSIYKGNATMGTAGTGNMYFGDSGLSISNTFKVSNAGALTATGVNITGTIDATSIKAKDGYYIYNSEVSNFKVISVNKVDNDFREVTFTPNDSYKYTIDTVQYTPGITVVGNGNGENSHIILCANQGVTILTEDGVDIYSRKIGGTSVMDALSVNNRRVLTTDEIYNYAADSYAYPSAKNVTTATNTNLGSITLAAGVYIIEYVASFASNSSGRREAWLSESTTGSNMNRYARTNIQAVNGASSFVHGTFISAYTTSKTFYLVGYQNSGSTLSCTYGIRAIRLINGTAYGGN